MGRKEKGEERKEEGLMARKLRRGVMVGKRGGTCTTPPPKWRLKDDITNDNNDNTNDVKLKNKRLTEFLSFETSPTVSARKLCANLWDIESQENKNKNPVAKMGKGGQRTRRRRQKSNGSRELPKNLANISCVNHEDHQPETASSVGRAASALLIQYRRPVERNDDRVLQPLSPASFGCSSMEVAPYKHAVTPTSSVDLKFKMVRSSYNLKTSRELIKVLNRIWSLEEEHASNMSLVRALKMELDHSRVRIKELLLEKELDRQEMDELVKRMTDDKLFRKSIEQDRIRAAVQSVCNELEDERKLRKRSEGLHRKLAREISELKSSFSNALIELERERKARILLENLCDEFAKGIGDYERELRSMKHKAEKERSSVDQPDRLILHISEAWLDERMQMKQAEAENIAHKITIVDKLGFDIATFLQAKQAVASKSRRYSLESFALNEAVSAPQNQGEEDSTDSDSRCLEPNKRDASKLSKSNSATEDHHEGLLAKSNSTKKKIRPQDLIKASGLPNLQGQLEEHMTSAVSCKGNKTEFLDKEEQGQFERVSLEGTEDLVTNGPMKSNRALDNLVRNRSLHSESCCREESCIKSLITGNASPVQSWRSKVMTPDFEKSESSLRWPQDLDENTLMAQLIEARLEKRRCSRTKPLKGSF